MRIGRRSRSDPTRSLARDERRRGDLRARQRGVAHPRRSGDARRRPARAARAGARAACDGRGRPAQQVPRRPVGSARAHHATSCSPPPTATPPPPKPPPRRVRSGAHAHPRRRSRHRRSRTRRTIPTCCSGSTRSRSSRSCSRTARTPGRVTAADADRYVAEMARVAEMVELPPGRGAAVRGRAARLPAVGARACRRRPPRSTGCASCCSRRWT